MRNYSDNYYGCYSFYTEQANRKALKIWLDHATKIPKRVNFLMALRNKIVSVVGLKNIGYLGGIDSQKSR